MLTISQNAWLWYKGGEEKRERERVRERQREREREREKIGSAWGAFPMHILPYSMMTGKMPVNI